MSDCLKLIVFVPESSKEELKNALFAAGAGKLGNYSHCCFEQKGKGQFKPLSGANPAIGEVEKIEYVDEMRIELLCERAKIKNIIKTLRAHHPYEEPAFDIYPTLDPEYI
jgi:hypothetical protein